MAEKKLKYAFGTDDTHCEADLFDTIEELIEYTQASWDDKDGNPFDEDCDYTGCIYVGTADIYEPADFAPSLDNIADQMTDKFYSDHYIDDDQDVTYSKKEEAQKEWREFINKYFDIPCTIIANWNVGIYDLKEHKWVERYGSDMNKEPIPMPTSNRIIQILSKKKQLYAIDPDEQHVIKRLRALTGAGIADSRKALRDNDYDFDKALARLKELVRKPAVLTNVKLQEGE